MIRSILSRAGIALAIASTLVGTAAAEGEWSGNVAIGTEYVWRGITQSQGDLAISGGFDYENGLFYAGTWASNVDFGDATDTNIEVDLYGGLTSAFANGVTWDVGVIGYFYPDSSDSDLDFVEVYGGLGYEFAGGSSVGGSVAYDPDNESAYIEATGGHAFTDYLSVDVSVGNYSFDGGGDYTNWSVGGTYSLEGFDIDVRYWGNDVETTGLSPSGADLLDDRVVVTLSRSL